MGLSASFIIHLLLSVGSLLLLSKIISFFLKKISVPTVLGEILLGILIGPTCLRLISPGMSGWLFPLEGQIGTALQTLVQFAVIMLLIVAGMEANIRFLWTEAKRVLYITLGSWLMPFIAGFLLVTLFPALFGVTPDRQLLLAFFIGIALTVSALPVIIRILMDLGLYHEKIGVMTVTSASVMDLLGWTAFTIILSWHHAAFIPDYAKVLWSHMTLLGFILGIVIANLRLLPQQAQKLASGFVVQVLSPLFFISIGIKVNFLENLHFALILVIILVATTSKILGTFLGGLSGGLGRKEALAVGFALNTRGAMEIILSKQALDAGLIPQGIFVALVIMALFTSLLSGPAIQYLIGNPQRKDTKLGASSV